MKILFLLIAFAASACSSEQEHQTKTIWIDVRTQAEWDRGHLPEAIHIPYQTIGSEISKITKNKNTMIKVYCKVGGRAGIAQKTLKKLGYKNLINAGGYEKILKSKQ